MGPAIVAFLVSGTAAIGARPQSASAPDDTLKALVQAERAFAHRAREKGWRAAFLEYFADDAIAFTPAPAPAKPRLRTQPVRPFSEEELTWEPRVGDVAASGEVGWLSGPSTFVDHTTKAPAVYGNYLTVWKRDAHGAWKAFIDVGTRVPTPVDFAAGFTRASTTHRLGPGDEPGQSTERLLDADRALNAAIAARGPADAYTAIAAPDARLHRNGSNTIPAVGRDTIAQWFKDHPEQVTATTTTGESSKAGDLGYTYGTYQLKGAPAPGAYVRVWVRNVVGRWLLQVDATVPPGGRQ